MISYPLTFMEDHARYVILHCLSRMNKAKVLQTQVVLTDTMQGIHLKSQSHRVENILSTSVSRNALARTSMQTLFCSLSSLHWMGLGKTPSKHDSLQPSSEYLTCDTDALAGEVIALADSSKMIPTTDTSEQTVYENELPRKQVLRLHAHYMVLRM